MSYKWKWTKEGRMAQVRFVTGEDIARLAELDQKCWAALSMPTTGVRFDARMLELMDTDGDGRIRTPEVIAAIDFLKAKNVNLDDLLKPSEADEKKLADVLARQADLARRPRRARRTSRRSRTGRRRARRPRSPCSARRRRPARPRSRRSSPSSTRSSRRRRTCRS